MAGGDGRRDRDRRRRGARARRPSARAQAEAALPGIGTAAGLGAIDAACHRRRRRLRWTSLVDAAAEAALIGAWADALIRGD